MAIKPSGWVADLFINILATLILTSTIFVFQRWRVRYPYAGIFELRPKRQFYIVCAGMEPDTFEVKKQLDQTPAVIPTENHDKFYGTGYGELIAMQYLTRVLTLIGHDMSQVISGIDLGCGHYFDRRKLNHDLILIGGATFNEVVKKFWPLIRDRLRYDIHDDMNEVSDGNFWIEDMKTRAKHSATTHTTGNKVAIDWGLITRVTNPYEPNSTLLIIDGLHSYGLIGASKFLLPNEVHRYAKQLRALRGREFQILVKCLVEPPEVFVIAVQFQTFEQIKINQRLFL